MEFLTFDYDDDFEDPEYTSGVEETIIFQYEDEGEYRMPYIISIESESGELGMCSHENDHGCLDYHIHNVLSAEREGYYVATGCEIDYSYDPFTGEGDSDFYYESIRPCVLSEIQALGQKITWRIFFQQLKLHWLYSHGYEL